MPQEEALLVCFAVSAQGPCGCLHSKPSSLRTSRLWYCTLSSWPGRGRGGQAYLHGVSFPKRILTSTLSVQLRNLFSVALVLGPWTKCNSQSSRKRQAKVPAAIFFHFCIPSLLYMPSLGAKLNAMNMHRSSTLSLSLSLSLSVTLSLFLSLSLSLSLTLCLSISLSLYLSFSLNLSLSLFLTHTLTNPHSYSHLLTLATQTQSLFSLE